MSETVLITGAGRGLGYELARIFYAHQYRVFPLVRTQTAAEELLMEMPYCHPIIADVGEDDCIDSIRTVVGDLTDTVDILINNAGIPGIAYQFSEVTTQEVGELFNVHCLGVIRTVKAVSNYLEQSANPRIINISSRLGSLAMTASGEFNEGGFSYSYRIAKAAQNMLSLCLDQELRKKGIHVSSIHPGKMYTSCASHDANLEPHEAAGSIFAWCQSACSSNTGQFLEPGTGNMPFPW
ncbi:SDR family NAD(P)-dependent oxidoreductase [Paenibacillus radicis (ex Xue et al. 2023)]|uniref:SDR family NAD(P)-dependent oxidoreductase n=1 Tax=Paenibacillus radicis (ex Xue et al. 2023) TaxID=2972489 RepID=A0ABT1YH26_9BACL|nr:SDR family NAD(P)-dependent oxidoreductase [Paenibacillus radicis (ex Xue et al. 2023)]MCR8632481.1 SDR family NAD(P)-dependent oxidoreductase [Paenibacillus radicis (ex Xue et al. 2023)]